LFKKKQVLWKQVDRLCSYRYTTHTQTHYYKSSTSRFGMICLKMKTARSPIKFICVVTISINVLCHRTDYDITTRLLFISKYPNTFYFYSFRLLNQKQFRLCFRAKKSAHQNCKTGCLVKTKKNIHELLWH